MSLTENAPLRERIDTNDLSAVPLMIADLERAGANGGAHLSPENLLLIAAALRGLSKVAGVETPPPYNPDAD